MPEISIKAEPIANIFGFHLTNSILLGVLTLIFIVILGFFYQQEIKSKEKSIFFYFFHFILKSIHGLFLSVLQNNTHTFFPLLGAFFIWILFQNWIGLFPGVGSIMIAVHEGEHIAHFPLFRGNNADLNATIALALISVTTIQVSGIKYLGFGGYIKKFIDISNPINFVVGILEIVSEFSKIISFAFRLFGNIFAGEVLMTIIAFIVPWFIPATFPFLLLEIFVGLIQALVFSLLTSVFLSMAITKHH